MDLDQLHTDIERYLREDMPPEERRAFEQRIEQEPQVKQEVLVHVLAEEAVSQKVEEEVRAKVNQVRRDEPLDATVPLWRRPALRVAAAVAVVLVAIGALQVFNTLSGTKPGAYEEQLLPYERMPVSKAQMGGDNQQAPWQECIGLFDAAEYVAAADCFQKYDPSSLQVQQFLAHTYFRLQAYDKAERAFERLIAEAEPESEEAVTAGYNLLLLQALQQQPGVARRIEELLQDPTYKYYQELQAIQRILQDAK